MRKFDADNFWGIPLTSGEHHGGYFYPVMIEKRLSFAVLPQMKLFDRHRLLRKIGKVAGIDLVLIRLHIADLAENKRLPSREASETYPRYADC